jgi:hypothetical protein
LTPNAPGRIRQGLAITTEGAELTMPATSAVCLTSYLPSDRQIATVAFRTSDTPCYL